MRKKVALEMMGMKRKKRYWTRQLSAVKRVRCTVHSNGGIILLYWMDIGWLAAATKARLMDTNLRCSRERELNTRMHDIMLQKRY